MAVCIAIITFTFPAYQLHLLFSLRVACQSGGKTVHFTSHLRYDHARYNKFNSSYSLVVESEQAEALPLAEDEANCGHPHLY